MGLSKDFSQIFKSWNSDSGNLENELLFYDFFRLEEGYDPARPFILCKDGGLLILYEMEGIDPEPIGIDGLETASNAIRRAMDTFNPANLDADWKGGTWEIQNIFVRSQGVAPLIPPPLRESKALRYLADSANDFWAKRVIYQDEIIWAVKFSPRFSEKEGWRLRDPQQEAVLKLGDLRAESRMFRRMLKTFEENLLAFTTRRPRMGFGLRPLDEDGCHATLWRQINRKGGSATCKLRRDVPLVVQVCSSERDDSEHHYKINGLPTKILTWKIPPAASIAYLFARLQNQCNFPFTLAQCFKALDFEKFGRKIEIFQNFAGAIAKKSADAARYEAEANSLIGSVKMDAAAPFNWYFTIIVQGETLAEVEDRAAKLASQQKIILSGDSLEETSNRVLAEISSLPGNGLYALRKNIVTSKNIGDLVMVYRLSPGDKTPFLLFGDRKGGVFSYSLFTRREPSWNKAILGLPGSGKSMLGNQMILGIAMFPSQGYVIDKGNSYGPLMELLEADMPGQVAVMRVRGGNFRFNPCPLVWALAERDRQRAEGKWKMELPGGGQVPCPVEQAKLFFEAWLDGLVNQGKPLDPSEKNLLDRSLKGGDSTGEGGFFRDYENQCRSYIRAKAKDPNSTLPPPRPLTTLLTHLRNEAMMFVSSVELWTRPPRNQFFDTGTDSVSGAKYIYFELEGLEDDPMLPVPFVAALMGTIWNRITDPDTITERKIVLIDEAWSFLAQPAFFSVIEMMFRTIRKFNGEVVLMTQTPADIKDGNARKLLQSMAEIFLYKGFTEPTFFDKDLSMTEHHVKLHESLSQDDRRWEVFYWSRSGLNRVLDVVITPAAYWYATTDAEDKYWRNMYWKRWGMVEGSRRLVEACDNRTIGSKDLRLSKVENYAKVNEVTKPKEEDGVIE